MVCRLCRDEEITKNTITIARVCNNYQRSEDIETPDPKMVDISGDDISCTRMYSHLKKSDVKEKSIVLCKECAVYLHKGHDDKVYQQWQYFWPAYLWDLLSSPEIQQEHVLEIWKFLPGTLRVSWIPQQQNMYIHLKNMHALLQVRKYLKDLSKEYLHYKTVENDLKITNIMDMYNKRCACDVRCPFGCTDFLTSVEQFHFIWYCVNL